MFKYTLNNSTFTPKTFFMSCKMNSKLVPFVLVSCLFGCTTAFHCYQCSYDKDHNKDKEWNDKTCMTSPRQLGRLNIYPCNDTHGFCYFQETYNLARKEVTSYYRQCSGTFRGNGCTEDATNLVCVGSCRGDFCTRDEIGRRYETYFGGASPTYNLLKYLFLYTYVTVCLHLYYFNFL